MEFWMFLICAVLLFLLYPRLRCFVKRILCAQKIRRVCKAKGFHLHPTHTLWFLGHKRAGKCDCYIETPHNVFAVKLFGMPARMCVLLFKENGEYFIRRYVALAGHGGSGVRYPIDSKPKALPVYDFRYQYKEAWEIKTPHNVLLVNPVSMEIRRQPTKGPEVIVGAGDVVNGMEIQPLSRLLGVLESAL